MSKRLSLQQPEDQVLLSRRDAAHLLGNVSIATLARLEKSGLLTPIRINRLSPTSQVFYARAEILAAATPAPIAKTRAKLRVKDKRISSPT